jgi:hypothetical protein
LGSSESPFLPKSEASGSPDLSGFFRETPPAGPKQLSPTTREGQGALSLRRGPLPPRSLLAFALGIPLEQFGVLPGTEGQINFKQLKIGGSYYQIDLPRMHDMQGVVERARGSGAGFLVERLKPLIDGTSAAFLMYSGTGPPLRLEGITDLAEKVSASSEGGRKLNVTFVGDGTPLEFDADKLTIAWRSAKGAPEAKVTFETPDAFGSIYKAEAARETLSIRDVSFARHGDSWVATQKIGTASIKVVAATRARAVRILSLIRDALVSVLGAAGLLTNDNSVDQAAFDALPPEVQHKHIDDAVALARKHYDALRRQSSEPSANDAETWIEIEIQNEKRSLRFAGPLRLYPMTWSGIGQANAAR